MNLTKHDYEIIQSSKQEIEWVESEINRLNQTLLAMPGEPESLLNYCIKENDEVIAGINACFYFGEFLWISVLFVKEAYRGKGLGSMLMSKVEEVAKEKGAKISHLHAFEFNHVTDFYLQQGYEVYGVLDDCPAKYKHYFFKKRLI